MKNSLTCERQHFDQFYAKGGLKIFEASPALRQAIQTKYQWLLTLIKPQKGDCLLSLGCGDGGFEIRLAPLVKRVVGLDLSPIGIQNARKRAKASGLTNTCFLVANLEKKIDFPDESFDKIISISTLHHLKDLENALKEVSRLCKKGGLLCLMEPNQDGLLRIIARRFFPKIYHSLHTHNETDISINQISQILKKVGFDIKKLVFYEFISLPCAFLWPGLPVGLFNLMARFDKMFGSIPVLKNLSSSFAVVCLKK